MGETWNRIPADTFPPALPNRAPTPPAAPTSRCTARATCGSQRPPHESCIRPMAGARAIAQTPIATSAAAGIFSVAFATRFTASPSVVTIKRAPRGRQRRRHVRWRQNVDADQGLVRLWIGRRPRSALQVVLAGLGPRGADFTVMTAAPGPPCPAPASTPSASRPTARSAGQGARGSIGRRDGLLNKPASGISTRITRAARAIAGTDAVSSQRRTRHEGSQRRRCKLART